MKPLSILLVLVLSCLVAGCSESSCGSEKECRDEMFSVRRSKSPLNTNSTILRLNCFEYFGDGSEECK